MMQDNGKLEKVDDEGSLFTKKEARHAWWRGITEFSVDEHFLFQQDRIKAPKQKRGEGAVSPHEIAPSNQNGRNGRWKTEQKLRRL